MILKREDIDRLSPEEKRALLRQLLQERKTEPSSFPLSSAQERIWFVEQMAEQTAVFNIARAFRLTGILDEAALQTAVSQVVAHHPALRTTLVMKDGRPQQRILASSSPDAQARATIEIKQDADGLAERLAHLPFDLEKGSLFRGYLLRGTNSQNTLLFVIHHLIADEWSLDILYRDLESFYSAARLAESSLNQTDVARATYKEFVAWQSEQPVPPQTDAFWRAQLDGWQPLALPPDRPPSIMQRFSGSTFRLALPPDLTKQLRLLARQEQVTPYTLLTAVFSLFLQRLSGQTDLLFGMPVSQRPTAEFQQLIGYFVDMLPFRIEVEPKQTFRAFLHAANQAMIKLQRHRAMPFGQLLQENRAKHDVWRNPFFETVLVWQSRQNGRLSLPNLQVEPIPLPRKRAKYELTLFVKDRPDQWEMTFEFDLNRFSNKTMARWATHFLTLLEAVVANPDSPITAVSILSLTQARTIVQEWNQTSQTWPQAALAPTLVAEQAAVRPNQLAIADANLTYGDLNHRANQLAHWLIAQRLPPEAVVPLLLPRSADLIIAQLAVLKAGVAFLPIDPDYPAERIRLILEDALDENGLILINREIQAAIPQLLNRSDRPTIVDLSVLNLHGQPSHNPDSIPLHGNNLAYLIYTSGSTGKPKGVQLTHHGLRNLIRWHHDAFALNDKDRTTHLANVAFDAAVWEIWPTLAAGATLYLPDEKTRRSPWLLRDFLLQHKITVAFAPTPLAETMLTISWPPQAQLRFLLTGGDRLRQHPADQLPFVLVNNYGPTEATVVATTQKLGANGRFPATHHSHENHRFPSIGRPLSNMTTYILDKQLRPVPVGVVGDLYIGGAGLARAYHDKPALTAEKFVPNPFAATDNPASRLYRTGDLARFLPDGRIEFVGRADTQIKIRGHRIELREIEVVLKATTAVSQAIVLFHEGQLNAFLVTDQDLNLTKLRQMIAAKLPSYMVPQTFLFLPQLPLTPHGKIDRRRLLQLAERHRAEQGQEKESKPEAADLIPASPIEELLLGLWADLLKQPKIGRFDNFFDVGGDSIVAIQIVARARAHDLDLQPHHLFEHPTVAELARMVQPLNRQVALAEKMDEPVPLSPIQHWFFAQAFTQPNYWNMPVVLHLPSSTDLGLLQTAVSHLVTHHKTLWLRFKKTARGMEGFYKKPAPLTIKKYVLPARLSSEAKKVEQAILRAANARLDLEAGPLHDLIHLRHADGENGRLYFIIHHLLVDGVSWRILLEDLAVLYHQLSAGQVSKLPPSSSSFQQWTTHLAQTAVSQADATFWQSDDYARQNLPIRAGQSGEVMSAIVGEIPPSYDELLAALAQALAGQTNKKRATIALEGHGREYLAPQLDLSRTVGWFTSLFPFSLPLDGTLAEKLAHIETRRAALPNKGLDFGWALSYGDAQTKEWLARLPQPEISFNYLGQFDQFLPDGAPFRLLDTLPPHARAITNKRPFPIQINAFWQNGRLHLSIKHQHDQAVIQQIARDFQAALVQLQGQPRKTTKGQQPTAKMARSHMLNGGLSGANIRSPAQQTMLQHSLAHPTSSAYRLQWSHRLEGYLHLDAFRKAWGQTLARYDTFQTKLPIGNLHSAAEQPSQWTMLDWRNQPPDRQNANLRAYLEADRQRPFASNEPPIRFGLIQLSERVTQFVWTIHHALIDGWSLAPVWRELFKRYAALQNGRSVTLSPVTPFQTYLDWRTRQDWSAAQTYWQTALAETPLPQPFGSASSWNERQISIGEAQTKTLTTLVREHRLTLNALLLGAWLRAWGEATQQTDFLFGITTSGRPVSLPDVDNIVGPFINTTPLRVRLTREPLLTWLPALQPQLVRHRQFDLASPHQIRNWLSLPAHQPLFDGFFRFQNYPAKRLLERHDGDFRVAETKTFDRWQYPLSVVAVPGDDLTLKLAWDNGRFLSQQIHQALDSFKAIIGQLTASP